MEERLRPDKTSMGLSFSEKDMNEALDRLGRTLIRMESAIRSSRGPWLQGKRPTLADVAVMPAIVRMADLNREGDWADLPRVAKWYELIQAQAAFKPTYYPGSLLSERFPHLKEKVVARA